MRHIFCLKHIVRNMATRFPTSLKKTVWKAAKARSLLGFEATMREISAVSAEAGQYLMELPRSAWTLHARTFPSHETFTSNPAESFNAVLRDRKDQSYYNILRFVIEHEIGYLSNLLNEIGTDQLIPKAREMLEDRNQKSLDWTSYAIGDLRGVAKNGRDEHRVDLRDRTCTCRAFQDCVFPCVHAFSLARLLQINPKEFVGVLYRTASYRELSAHRTVPVLHSEVSLAELGTPTIQPSRGRKKKRQASTGEREERAGDAEDVNNGNKNKCSLCGGHGHNRRTCNRRQ